MSGDKTAWISERNGAFSLPTIYSNRGVSEFICRSSGRSCRGKSFGQRKDKKPRILAIPREEEGNPSPVTQAEDKNEDERVEAALDQRLKDRPQLNETVASRMVL
jgi:hypothetical protein